MRLIDVLLIGLLQIALHVRSAAACSITHAVNLSEESNSTFNLRSNFRRFVRERSEFRLDTTPKNFGDYLQFNTSTFDVIVQKVDRETCQSESVCNCHPSGSPCYATLSISVLQDHKLQCTLSVTFSIVDINDNAPTWSDNTQMIELRFNENEAAGTVNPTPIAATDADAPGPNSQLSYRLVPSSPDFTIESRNGFVQLRTARVLDREARSNYSFRLEAVDHGTPARTGTIALTVIVEDVNDHAPAFSSPLYNVTVDETAEVGDSVVQVRATDNDVGARINYQLVEHADRSTFRINDDGVVYLSEKLDFESRQAGQPFYRFTVFAYDNGSPPRSSSAVVVVHVRDVNDHPPSVRAPTDVRVSENLPRGSYTTRITVEDVDYGPVRCWLPQSDPHYFTDTTARSFELKEDGPVVSAPTGTGVHRAYTLLTAIELDREQASEHIVHIICADQNGLPGGLSATATVTVHVTDVNDRAPIFDRDRLTFSVAETYGRDRGVASSHSMESGEEDRLVGYVAARDEDDGINALVTYALQPSGDSCFSIDPQSGRIGVRCPLDREYQDTYSLQVLATDSGVPPRNSSATIRINVTDVNDCVPTFNSDTIVFNVEESASYTRVGSLLGYVSDCDVGRNAQLSFKLNHGDQSEEAKRFTINAQGELYTLSELDREMQPSYTLVILVHDNGEYPLSSSASIVVRIADINDNSPVFERQSQNSFNVSCLERVGHVITRLLAIDRDAEENGTVRYSIAAGNAQGLFAINATSGELLVVNSLISARGTYKLKIVAFDHGRTPRNSSIEVNVSIDSVTSISGSNRQVPEDALDSDTSSNFRPNMPIDPMYEARDGSSERNMYEKANEIVIISLAAIFIVLLFVTVALIVWLKRKDSLPVVSAKRSTRKSPAIVKHESMPLSDKSRGSDMEEKSQSNMSRQICSHHSHHTLPSNGYQSINIGDKTIDDDVRSDGMDDENLNDEEIEHGSGYESPDSCDVDDGSRSRAEAAAAAAAADLHGPLRHVAAVPYGAAHHAYAQNKAFPGIGRQIVAVHTPHVHSHMLNNSSNLTFNHPAPGLESLALGAHAREPLSLIRCDPPLKYGGAVATLPAQAYNDYNPLRVAQSGASADRVLHMATPVHHASLMTKQRQFGYPACATHRRHAHAHSASSTGPNNSHLYYEINGTNVTSDCSESVCAYMSNALDANANTLVAGSLPRPAAPAPLAHKRPSISEQPPALDQTSKKPGPLYGEASYV